MWLFLISWTTLSLDSNYSSDTHSSCWCTTFFCLPKSILHQISLFWVALLFGKTLAVFELKLVKVDNFLTNYDLAVAQFFFFGGGESILSLCSNILRCMKRHEIKRRIHQWRLPNFLKAIIYQIYLQQHLQWALAVPIYWLSNVPFC